MVVMFYIGVMWDVPQISKKEMWTNPGSCDHFTSISASSSDWIFGTRNQNLFRQRGGLSRPHIRRHLDIMPQSHCAESTAERGRIDHSCSVGGSFLVILAMTMTFHSWLCALKTCSYLLCHTADVLYSSHSNCILRHSCM